MSIADFSPQSAEIPFKGGSFTVRGLNLNDVSVLLRLHLEDLVLISQRYQGVPEAQGMNTLLEFVAGLPGLTANIIGAAADEDDPSQFGRLPFGLQMLALQKIGELTCEDFGGPGKLWAAVQALVSVVKAEKTDAIGLLPPN